MRAFAHRGGGLEAEENTLESFFYAHDLGYRRIETDAHLSHDGQVILNHDPDLSRVFGVNAQLSALSWRQLASLRGKNGGRLLRLRDALALFPDTYFNVDAKHPAVVDRLFEDVARAHALDRVNFASFQAASLRRLRQLGAKHTALTMPEIAALKIRSVLKMGPGNLRHLVAAGIECVQIPTSHTGVDLTSADFVDTAHEAGLKIDYWTIDDRSEIRRLLEIGADGIITDRPAVLKEVLLDMGCWEGRSAA
ncbi:MAG: glycerophosphodiester phosphodiesterase family protein [Actinomycetaceae bacterium]|nr:glycerophosphodiester phosphodiesterase family protein [Actinomycetaceae bacterium]